MDGVGSHLSSHIWISFPLPTLHRVPFFMTSTLLCILLQEYEGELPSLAFRTSPVGKYFDLRTWATRDVGFDRILQAYFASMAWLKALKFRNPMPPFAFEIHILFQLTQLIFASFCFWPHQKFRIILSKSSHKLCGSSKQLIVYIGISWAIALMRISSPPH